MPLHDIELRRGVRIPAKAMRWWAARSSGPGGQNVNKRATKVELRVSVAQIEGLHPEARERLRQLAGHRWVDADDAGELRLVSESARSQGDNLHSCLDEARELVARALIRPRSRKATKPTRGSQRRRLEGKRQQSQRKKLRGRVDRGGD